MTSQKYPPETNHPPPDAVVNRFGQVIGLQRDLVKPQGEDDSMSDEPKDNRTSGQLAAAIERDLLAVFAAKEAAEAEVTRLRQRVADDAKEIADMRRDHEEMMKAMRAQLRLTDEALTAERARGILSETDKPATPSRPRIVVVPHTSPSPHKTWRAYCPERPGIGSHHADSENGAREKAFAALRETGTETVHPDDVGHAAFAEGQDNALERIRERLANTIPDGCAYVDKHGEYYAVGLYPPSGDAPCDYMFTLPQIFGEGE